MVVGTINTVADRSMAQPNTPPSVLPPGRAWRIHHRVERGSAGAAEYRRAGMNTVERQQARAVLNAKAADRLDQALRQSDGCV